MKDCKKYLDAEFCDRIQRKYQQLEHFVSYSPADERNLQILKNAQDATAALEEKCLLEPHSEPETDDEQWVYNTPFYNRIQQICQHLTTSWEDIVESMTVDSLHDKLPALSTDEKRLVIQKMQLIMGAKSDYTPGDNDERITDICYAILSGYGISSESIIRLNHFGTMNYRFGRGVQLYPLFDPRTRNLISAHLDTESTESSMDGMVDRVKDMLNNRGYFDPVIVIDSLECMKSDKLEVKPFTSSIHHHEPNHNPIHSGLDIKDIDKSSLYLLPPAVEFMYEGKTRHEPRNRKERRDVSKRKSNKKRR